MCPQISHLIIMPRDSIVIFRLFCVALTTRSQNRNFTASLSVIGAKGQYSTPTCNQQYVLEIVIQWLGQRIVYSRNCLFCTFVWLPIWTIVIQTLKPRSIGITPIFLSLSSRISKMSSLGLKCVKMLSLQIE